MAVAVSGGRPITAKKQETARVLVDRARQAMAAAASYDQAAVDRLCRAVAWAGGNEQTAITLANMSVDESGMGSREPKRRGEGAGHFPGAALPKNIGLIE